MNFKTRLLIATIGIAIMFLLAFTYRICKGTDPQLTQTDVGLTCDGTKVTYYIDQNGTEYIQFNDGEIEVIKK